MAEKYAPRETRFIYSGTEFTAELFLALKFEESWLKVIQETISFWLGNSSKLSLKTSGSSGLPKTIELDRSVLRQSAKATLNAFNLKGNDSAILFLPCQFIGGKMMVIRALIGGLKLHLLEPKSALPVLEQHYDFVALTPMQAANSLSQLNSFDQILVGGGAVHANLLNDLQSIEAAVFHSYGMTETASHIALRKLNGPNASDDFIALKDISFSVDKRNCLRIDAPLWDAKKLQTNDVVELKSPAIFVWRGRADNVINSGGVKINPEEIEKLLEQQIHSPFFISSLPDQKTGEKLVLFVEGKLPKDLNFKALPKLHQPKKTIVLSTFEYTKTDKINRQKTVENFLNSLEKI